MLSISLERYLESISITILTEIYSLAEMSIIRQLAKRDYHKEQDVQPSCERSSVSGPKNDENLT